MMSKMGELYEEMREKNNWDEADRCADERKYKEHILKLDKRKELVASLRATEDEHGFEFGKKVSDWMFAIETEYQAFYGLEENDFDIIDKNSQDEQKVVSD